MKLSTILKEPGMSLVNSYNQTFDIPTQIVITKPGVYVPEQGRCWPTHQWEYKGQILNYEELIKATAADGGFQGTANYPQIYLYEVWIDQGDDGHTAYRCVGYMYVVGEQSNPLDLWKRDQESLHL